MKKFMAIVLLMGTVRKPEVSHYWTTNPLLKGSIFNSVMPRNSFQSVFCILQTTVDMMQMIQSLTRWGLLSNTLVSKFIPEHISIDEEFLLWKGRPVFKQFIPLRDQNLASMFSLWETTGYLGNSYVYLGKWERAWCCSCCTLKVLNF